MTGATQRRLARKNPCMARYAASPAMIATSAANPSTLYALTVMALSRWAISARMGPSIPSGRRGGHCTGGRGGCGPTCPAGLPAPRVEGEEREGREHDVAHGHEDRHQIGRASCRERV